MDEVIGRFTNEHWAKIVVPVLLTISAIWPTIEIVTKVVDFFGWVFSGGLAKFFAEPSIARLIIFHSLPLAVYLLASYSEDNRDYFRTFIFFHFAAVYGIIVVIYAPRAWSSAMKTWPLEKESDFLSMAIWNCCLLWTIWAVGINMYSRPWPMHGFEDEFNTLLTTYGSFLGIPFIELAYRFHSGKPFHDSLIFSLVIWLCVAVFTGTLVAISGPVIR